jgi:hypothetical protein
MISEETKISSLATALVREHFELLNAGRLEEARKQLFFPVGMNDRPLTVYVEAMGRLAPFVLRSLRVKRYEDVRPIRHGRAATVWLDLAVAFALGERTAEMTVWWFPDDDKILISSRPSEWTLEAPLLTK